MSNDKELITELKKMNELLEKIDWKLWTFHTKFFGESETTGKRSSETLATTDVKPVVITAKYPTIETWE